jgi:S1-C subfamily serine protease
MTVDLAGSPVRVGISWRDDDAEPGAAIVTRVVPGSRAQRAGVRPGDRIYEVSGRQYDSGDELRELLTTLDGPIEFTLERRGRLSRVSIDLPPVVRADVPERSDISSP